MIILRKKFCRLNPVKLSKDNSIIDVKKTNLQTYSPTLIQKW